MMDNLNISFIGTVKFYTTRSFDNGTTLHEYLVQATNQADKVSSITVKYFTQYTHQPIELGKEIKVVGYLQENKWKDAEGTWRTSGLQVIASNIGEYMNYG